VLALKAGFTAEGAEGAEEGGVNRARCGRSGVPPRFQTPGKGTANRESTRMVANRGAGGGASPVKT